MRCPSADVLGPGGPTSAQDGIGRAGHDARVFDLSFSPTAPELLASASDDESVKVWRQHGTADDPRLELVANFGDHTDSVLRVSWSPDGRLLASGASE